MKFTLITVLLITTAIIIVSAVFVAAVPPTFANFVPEKNAVQYGLVILPSSNDHDHHSEFARVLAGGAKRDQNSNNNNYPTKFKVLEMDSIVRQNLTSKVRATAWYNKSLDKIGWDYLFVKADPKLISNEATTEEAYWYAGAIEGWLTYQAAFDQMQKHLKANHDHNADDDNNHISLFRKILLGNERAEKFFNKKNHSESAIKWVEDQIAWTQQQVLDHHNNNNNNNDHGSPSPSAVRFWKQVGNQMSQLEGLAAGMNAKAFWPLKFDLFEIYAINLDMEWNAIEAAVAESTASSSSSSSSPIFLDNLRRENRRPNKKQIEEFTHCSGLIKVTSKDLFVSQVVWGPTDLLGLRMYKTYEFQTTVVFSSYFLTVVSNDDFYALSSEIVSLETTNGNYDHALYKNMRPQTAAEFLRVAVANQLATDGKSWVDYFSMHVSGTYNNQWMVVSLFLFDPTVEKLAPGLLWVAEQYPCQVVAEDVTYVLQSQRYWPSYNIPFFTYVYNITGFEKQFQQYGDFFSYSQYARAKIFRERHSDVTDLASMQLMMRYNNFEHDPASKIPNCSTCPNDTCNPTVSAMQAVASRGDLTSASCDGGGGGGGGGGSGDSSSLSSCCYGPLAGYLSPRQFGALDAKIASWSERKSMTTVAISGPTNVQQKSYEWPAKAWVPPGVPKVWNFPWVTFFMPSL